MNAFIYLIYPILLFALLWGSKRFVKGTWNEDAFSLKQMKALQGFAAICIMLHHIGQKTCASWLSPKQFVAHGLDLFVPIGYYFVCFFLFCSGYGLYVSFHAKENYLNGFFKKRILPIILSYYSTGLIFLLARFLMHEPLDTAKVLIYAFGLKLSNPNAWFVIIMPFLYLFFYLAFRFCKKDGLAVFVTFLCVFLYMLLGTFIDHNDWWIRGEWWYNSVHGFPLGILFAKYQNKIVEHLKRHYLIYLIPLFFGIFLTNGFSVFAQNRFSYYGEYWGAPDKVLRRWICLLSQILASSTFVLFIFVAGLKIRIGNRFLAFMGGITLEFYLIHGLFLELFAYNFAGVAPSLCHLKNVPLLVILVFLPAIPAALLLQKFHKWVTRDGSF